MVKTKIQQSIAREIVIFLTISLIFTALFSSCIQLRYTNYGKPFDFLHARNQYPVFHKSKQDSASIFQANAYTAEETEQRHQTSIKFHTNNSDSTIESECQKKSDLVAPESQSISIEVATIREKSHSKTKHTTLSTQLKKISNYSSISQVNGPGWWEDFWKGFWNFVLKWLLIILAFFVILALIIWGIYMLISLIAGPLAAGIFLSIVLILFWILMNT